MQAQALDAIQAALDQVRAQTLGVHAFSAAVHSQTDLLAALPERYRVVLDDLLNRLESSALFSEESCSFSQSGLLDNLQLWVDRARGQIGPS
jgi:hypothetical protein